jgi:hypothetical protein
MSRSGIAKGGRSAAKSHFEVKLIPISVYVEHGPTDVAVLLACHDKGIIFSMRVSFSLRASSSCPPTDNSAIG